MVKEEAEVKEGIVVIVAETGGGGGNQATTTSGGSDGAQTHPRHKGPRHSDLPPFKSCSRHWFFGKSAHFCEEPGTCPWKDVWIPKSNQ